MSSLTTKLTGAFRLIRVLQIITISFILFTTAYLWRGWNRAGCDIPDRLWYNVVTAVFSAVLLPLSLWGTSLIRSRSRFLRNDTSPSKTQRTSSICSLTCWTLALDLILLIAWLSLVVHHSYPCANVCERCAAPALLPSTRSGVSNVTRAPAPALPVGTRSDVTANEAADSASQFYVWAGALTCSCYGCASNSGGESSLRRLAAQVLRKFHGSSHRPGHGDVSTRIISGEEYGGLRSGLDAGISGLLFLTLLITLITTVQTVRSARRNRRASNEFKMASAGQTRVPRVSVYYVDEEKQAKGGSGSGRGSPKGHAVGGLNMQ